MGTIVFLLEKDEILHGSTLVFDFYDHMEIYTREYHYIFEKYHVKKFEKQGGLSVCGGVFVGNRSDTTSTFFSKDF